MHGRIHSIQVSAGGVPKLPIDTALLAQDGVEGDRQAHPAFHGGPERAVCLLGLDAIERLQAEGHPIRPGAIGENLTLAGLDWAQVTIGTRFCFSGGAELEARSHAAPCGTIAAAFSDGRFARVSGDSHPGEARIYAAVLIEGRVSVGEAVEVTPPADDAGEG